MDVLDSLGLEGPIQNYSLEEICAAIETLQKAKTAAKRQEKAERQRREREERERREREEREQKEAHIREVTCMDLPLDWNNAFQSDIRTQGAHVECVSDGLVWSLNTLGRVDIEYIAAVTGADYKTVIGALKGSIYQNPETWGECFYQGWETAEEYLSGNLMRKWKAAKKADQAYQGYFSDNVKAIERVLPPAVPAEDIYITLGSPWVPTDVIDDFILSLFGEPVMYLGEGEVNREKTMEFYQTRHDEITGAWEIPGKSRYLHKVGVTQTYGTERMGALHILEKTLNMKTVAVTDEIGCPTNASGKKRVVNQGETVAALEKQQKLIHAFQAWVWADETRKKRLETIFEDNYGCVRRRIFDGSFLTFPTLSPSIQLYPYQKDAVARIIFSPNTLLAHDVGSGKTYVMIAAGQELRRMGLSRKNMYVVPNNIVGQWRDIFLTMYPDAKLLCVWPKAFTPGKREKVLEKIQNEDFDGIIIAYSCFEQIPLSKAYSLRTLEWKKEEIDRISAQNKKATSRLERKRRALEKVFSELSAAMDEMCGAICFDDLGITRLFVDEAHNFKNVPIDTQTANVLGVSGAGSKKCQDMMDKVHMVQRENSGGGVVFATGTPITNSITDAYIMQQYLQSGELTMLDLQSFDSWIGMFAERATEFEIDVDTKQYRLATRFAKFHNLPELTSLLSSIADFHQADRSAGLPELDGYQDAVISKTPAFSAYLDRISDRAEEVRNGWVSRSEDNMLKITADGRKAALDLRLVDSKAVFTYQSKVARCAETVADLYFKTYQAGSTQLVFCDTSTPKAGFNLYDELKDRLIRFGVSEDQIAFIHSAGTEAGRSALFAAVRAGQIRILIGSTFKLGLGVNVQDKLIALHHLDVPWRPADMVQREGRILRQGNENGKIHIFRYITEGSFDAYSWQLLEAKQRMIAGILSGSLAERSGPDIEGTALNYAEVKALAVGDPLIKERVAAANELARYTVLQRRLVEAKLRMEQELMELPAKMRAQREAVLKCEGDLARVLSWKASRPAQDGGQGRREQAAERKAIRERIRQGLENNVLKTKETPLMKYRGFDVILPANMTLQKPYVWLSGQGRYYVELGSTEVGNLARIDHFLNNLGEYLRTLKLGCSKLEKREAELKVELAKGETYTEEIERYRKKVELLDKELGVN